MYDVFIFILINEYKYIYFLPIMLQRDKGQFI